VPLIGDLTRPENGCELKQRRRILRILNERGGCWACTNRDKTVLVWGRAVCTTRDRAFPKCTQDGKAPAFELDEQQLKDTP
jgi:hypothetical protein